MDMDLSVLSPSERAHTTARFDDPQAPVKVAHRFWNTPELVHHLLTFLSKDRIDLLTISRVSKVLRAQSLKVWATHLDIPVTVASNRSNFFKANPSLLNEIQYLRLRTSNDYDLDCSHRFNETFRNWHDLNELLVMLSKCPLHSLPVIDLTILPFDPLRLPTVLKQRVVALRILSSHLYDSERGEPISGLVQHNSESLEVDVEGTWDLPWAPSASIRWNGAVAQGGWDNIIDLLEHAAQGPGLKAFEIEASRVEVAPLASYTIDAVLRPLLQHASILRDLRIKLNELGIPNFLLPASRFDHLETLELGYSSPDQVPMIEILLDGLTNVRQLYIWAPYDTTLSLRQTFPHLRVIKISHPEIDPNKLRNFAERHETVQIVDGYSLLPPAYELTGYPNLGCITVCSPEDLQGHLDHGRAPYLASFVYGLSAADLRRYFSLLRSYPEAARRLTCLKMFDHQADDPVIFSTTLASACFPNLVELYLEEWGSDRAVGNDEDTWRLLIKYLASLRSAHALRLIHLSALTADIKVKDPDILRDEMFPPSLEYVVFAWNVSSRYGDKTYRFVSSHPEGLIIKTAESGKRGFLQLVPAAIHTPITKAGVWNRPVRSHTPHTILDHMGIHSS